MADVHRVLDAVAAWVADPLTAGDELPFRILPEVTTDWSDYYKNIVDVIDNGAELIVKPEQCLRVMKVIDLIFESDRQSHGLACRI
ncbi:hypothetical protein H6B10_14900 [Gemmiger formicilis]|nr:hypothetical protein [Gemmiger formicilis]